MGARVLYGGANKCCFLTEYQGHSVMEDLNIYLGDKRINVTDSYNYLGTCLGQSLNMRLHLDKVNKKVSSKLKLLSMIRPLLTRSAAQGVYKAVVVPGILN